LSATRIRPFKHALSFTFDAVGIGDALELAVVATVGVFLSVRDDSISASGSSLDVNTEVESSGDKTEATVNSWVEVHSQVLGIGSLAQIADESGNSSVEVDSVELEAVAESPESSSLGSNVNRVEFSLNSGDSQQAKIGGVGRKHEQVVLVKQQNHS